MFHNLFPCNIFLLCTLYYLICLSIIYLSSHILILFIAYLSLQECELHKIHIYCVYFVHSCIPSTKISVWQMVGDSTIIE